MILKLYILIVSSWQNGKYRDILRKNNVIDTLKRK